MTSIVTFLFTDVVASTELFDSVGDAGAQAIRGEHFAALRDAITAHRGTVVKTLGDGLMVTFNNATDAVDCARAIQQATRRQRRWASKALDVRVGVHVGEAIVDEGDYFGRAVVVAKRLCDHARGGQILASTLVRDFVVASRPDVFRPAEDLALKGLNDAVSACEVVWDDDPTGARPLPRALRRTDASPFVGRDAELGALLETWRSVVDGEPVVAVACGEPGIGKTRLVKELAVRVAGDGGTVLFGGCDESGSVPLQPFAEALADRFAQDRGRGWTRRVPADLGELLPQLAHELDGARLPASPVDDRMRLFQAVAAALGALADEAPVLLALDDIQWADEASAALLSHIVRDPALSGVMVVGTCRDAELDDAHPINALAARLRREGRWHDVTLGGLHRSDVAAWVTGRVGVDDLADAIHNESEGNPLFVHELLLHLEENGFVTSGRAEVGMPITAGIRDVVTRRVARLSHAARRVLDAASVVGDRFTIALVERAADVAADDVVDALDEMIKARLVTEDDATPGQFHFAHGLIRKTVYEQLTTVRRTKLHRLLGEALEDLHVDALPHHADELAWHFGEAASTGADAAAKAATYEAWAGVRAIELHAYGAGARHFEHALELAPSAGIDAAQRCEILLGLGDARMKAGAFDEARGAFVAAADEARLADDAGRFARAALGYGGEPWRFGYIANDETLVALLDEALGWVGTDDASLRVHLLARAAIARYQDDVSQRGAHLAAEAVAMAGRLGDTRLRLLATEAQYVVTRGPDVPLERFVADVDGLLADAERCNDVTAILTARQLRAVALVQLGDLEHADKDIAVMEEMTRGMRLQSFWVVAYKGMRAALEGRFDDGERLALEAFERARATALDVATVNLAAQLVAVRWGQGRLSDIVEGIDEFAEAYPQFPAVRAAAAFVHSELGDREEALAAYRWFADRDFDNLPRDDNWLMGMWLLSFAARFLDDVEGAAHLYDALTPYGSRFVAIGSGAVCTGSAQTALGVLAATMGRVNEAAEHFKAAAEDNRATGALPFAALAEREYARVRNDGPGVSEGPRSPAAPLH